MTKGINMEYFSENDEAKVKDAMTAAFPGYYVSFMEDPDDSSVVFVRLYDVAESDIGVFKQKLRKILRENVCISDADLIPSIVSSKNTQLYYPEYLRQEVQLDAEDICRLTAKRFDNYYTWKYKEPALLGWQIESNIPSMNLGVADVGQTRRFAA
jgi:hypothetical protein